MVDAFNAAKLDYATFGNHEFDLDLDTLVARIADSKFKWVSSNCTLANGAPLPKVLPWDTLRVSGHKVGLFGLTLQGNYRPDGPLHRSRQRRAAGGPDPHRGRRRSDCRADPPDACRPIATCWSASRASI